MMGVLYMALFHKKSAKIHTLRKLRFGYFSSSFSLHQLLLMRNLCKSLQVNLSCFTDIELLNVCTYVSYLGSLHSLTFKHDNSYQLTKCIQNISQVIQLIQQMFFGQSTCLGAKRKSSVNTLTFNLLYNLGHSLAPVFYFKLPGLER